MHLGYLYASGNFHEVLPGQLYRSAQPDAAALDWAVKRYGIRTVINLRGENPGAAWYREEIAESRSLGLTHVDFRMSAGSPLTVARSEELIALMRAAPKPILIHCRSGSDRTGLAAVMYLQQIAGIDEETAEAQLSPVFGHIGIPYLSTAYAMDETWESLEAALGIDS
jgi:protein tyrosine/serine phosphatase